jgi:hypothetical protein
MPIDPDSLKQDPRSPQELAKAILDHEFTPRATDSASISFRERLLMDLSGDQGFAQRKHAFALVWALKNLEENIPLSKVSQRDLRHALRVTSCYRQESAEFTDLYATAAEGGASTASLRREAAKSMHASEAEISNLGSIEQLLRTLAPKIGVSFIGPRGRR